MFYIRSAFLESYETLRGLDPFYLPKYPNIIQMYRMYYYFGFRFNESFWFLFSEENDCVVPVSFFLKR